MLASAVHNVAKYYQKVLENTKYQRPKRSSNKIRILQRKFEFEKKEFNIPNLVTLASVYMLNAIHTNKTGILIIFTKRIIEQYSNLLNHNHGTPVASAHSVEWSGSLHVPVVSGSSNRQIFLKYIIHPGMTSLI